jgi:ubiquinone/menaquinone biosynthesis C-methylase UbiE
MDTLKGHWEGVYKAKTPTQVSWYQPHLERSLALVSRAGLRHDASIIDVGGGASTLVDDLLARGFTHMTVLDISGEALRVAKTRLGIRADDVRWVEADVTEAALPQHGYDLWHDRAVFHFFTDADKRNQYVGVLRRALRVEGQMILATFGVNGPPRCSGLEVVRYNPEQLQAELGKEFRLLETLREDHLTPFGGMQEFIYCRFQKLAEPRRT